MVEPLVEAEPTEVARMHIPRTGDTVHIGYGHDGTTSYVTIGYADCDLVELDPETALAALGAFTAALRGAFEADQQHYPIPQPRFQTG